MGGGGGARSFPACEPRVPRRARDEVGLTRPADPREGCRRTGAPAWSRLIHYWRASRVPTDRLAWGDDLPGLAALRFRRAVAGTSATNALAAAELGSLDLDDALRLVLLLSE